MIGKIVGGKVALALAALVAGALALGHNGDKWASDVEALKKAPDGQPTLAACETLLNDIAIDAKAKGIDMNTPTPDLSQKFPDLEAAYVQATAPMMVGAGAMPSKVDLATTVDALHEAAAFYEAGQVIDAIAIVYGGQV